MALLSVSAAPPTEALRQLTKSHLAFQGNPCALQRSPTLQGVRDTASCRMPKTRLHSLSEASTVAHLEENVDRHMDHQLKARTEPEVSIDPLQLLPRHHGMVVKPHNQRASIACIVSHALDGISAIFSLACGSATLACMGILEWSSIASLALIIGSFTTAVGSLMLLATTAVGVLALFDAVRTPAVSGKTQAVEDVLQALAAPPRRLGSMNSIR
eukprot:CAMPEP_0179451932 /NCGR_PEP_ID=MMETSP0799-20121207/35943_1 /TAXON_ID=46947 /ORGANISM="Geminigera cryophila, Strain CCMP2564" /LENGTH=213 /DNA_ID=CAMNT_0021247599 /DNA_START=172 /DNA_END=813 /DNA_ORIENTATION=-